MRRSREDNEANKDNGGEGKDKDDLVYVGGVDLRTDVQGGLG